MNLSDCTTRHHDSFCRTTLTGKAEKQIERLPPLCSLSLGQLDRPSAVLLSWSGQRVSTALVDSVCGPGVPLPTVDGYDESDVRQTVQEELAKLEVLRANVRAALLATLGDRPVAERELLAKFAYLDNLVVQAAAALMRCLPTPTTSEMLLKHMFDANLENPYPTEHQKRCIAARCDMTEVQVSMFFTNRRARTYRCPLAKRTRGHL
mmetsp:Transcript_10195/g.32317  ORF Transcript_10195/g.32317 Transcript_10195/m.32317 type:complete len:207 (+) Transcript_10195:98-718(+)